MRIRHYSSNLTTLQTRLPRSALLRADSFLPPCLFVTSLNSEQLFPRGILIFPHESEQMLTFFFLRRTSGKGLDIVNILMISVTLVVVAIPEGNSPSCANIHELKLSPQQAYPSPSLSHWPLRRNRCLKRISWCASPDHVRPWRTHRRSFARTRPEP